jgi:hypothetical protein
LQKKEAQNAPKEKGLSIVTGNALRDGIRKKLVDLMINGEATEQQKE